jgi:hypothetical protein
MTSNATANLPAPRLSDIESGTWMLADDTHLTYQPDPGTEVRRRVRVWTGTGSWHIAVVTETGTEPGPAIAAVPDAALAAAREQFGPGTLLFDDYEPAGDSYMQPTRYSWLIHDRTGQPYWVAFRPSALRALLPGLLTPTLAHPTVDERT